MAKLLTAVKIDAHTQTITLITIGQSLRDWYAAIGGGCDIVQRVALCAGTDLWIDEEGCLRNPVAPKFRFKGNPTIFVGSGLILGLSKSGERSLSTIYTPEQIVPLIEFLGDMAYTPPPMQMMSWPN